MNIILRMTLILDRVGNLAFLKPNFGNLALFFYLSLQDNVEDQERTSWGGERGETPPPNNFGYSVRKH